MHALLYQDIEEEVTKVLIKKEYLVIDGLCIMRGSLDENCMLVPSIDPNITTMVPKLV